MANVLQKEPDGRVTWFPQAQDTYLVTGTTTNGKRFSVATKTWAHARGINVWRGSKWLIRDGKRHLIQRVTN